MRDQVLRKAFILASCVVMAGALAAAPSLSVAAREMALHSGQGINVNVNFSTRLPLPDMSDDALAATQQRGRRFIYRMAMEECGVLKSTIAESCRLTHINISAQIQDHDNRGPARIYMNGNATFAITPKGF